MWETQALLSIRDVVTEPLAVAEWFREICMRELDQLVCMDRAWSDLDTKLAAAMHETLNTQFKNDTAQRHMICMKQTSQPLAGRQVVKLMLRTSTRPGACKGAGTGRAEPVEKAWRRANQGFATVGRLSDALGPNCFLVWTGD